MVHGTSEELCHLTRDLLNQIQRTVHVKTSNLNQRTLDEVAFRIGHAQSNDIC
jgi:hypothetical protein